MKTKVAARIQSIFLGIAPQDKVMRCGTRARRSRISRDDDSAVIQGRVDVTPRNKAVDLASGELPNGRRAAGARRLGTIYRRSLGQEIRGGIFRLAQCRGTRDAGFACPLNICVCSFIWE